MGLIWYCNLYFYQHIYCTFSQRLKYLVWANVLHFISPLSINSWLYKVCVFGPYLNSIFRLELHQYTFYYYNTQQYFNSLSCDCSVWIPLFPIVLVYLLYSAYFLCSDLCLNTILLLQGLTGLGVKSTNSNNNNNNNNSLHLNRYFNIERFPFAAGWRVCVMD